MTTTCPTPESRGPLRSSPVTGVALAKALPDAQPVARRAPAPTPAMRRKSRRGIASTPSADAVGVAREAGTVAG
ncbi:MAG TPA: hypothetical protein PLR25_18995, partial [Planctomycetaceae bacterium]|nr:hypothetical protein [Planctomycetaceae bacterium]